MKRMCLVSCLFFLAIPTAAHADPVSERVLLTSGGAGCPSGQTGFRRINAKPDGSWTVDSTEFQVPYGSYLEVTSIEYTLPYWTSWAKFFVQTIDFMVRQRAGTQSTTILSVRYGNQTGYYEDANDAFLQNYQFTSQGAQTHVAAFPSGPLVSSAGRLCMTSKNEYWMYGGNVRIRGRLIASGEPPKADPGSGVLSP